MDLLWQILTWLSAIGMAVVMCWSLYLLLVGRK